MKKSFTDYVCPHCLRQLSECTCYTSPWQLLQIDEGLQEAIRILNIEKNLYTMGCCEGHYEEDRKQRKNGIYISFLKDSVPQTAPKGWSLHNDCMFYDLNYNSKIPQKSVIQFDEHKEQGMKALYEWLNELEPNKDI